MYQSAPAKISGRSENRKIKLVPIVDEARGALVPPARRRPRPARRAHPRPQSPPTLEWLRRFSSFYIITLYYTRCVKLQLCWLYSTVPSVGCMIMKCMCVCQWCSIHKCTYKQILVWCGFSPRMCFTYVFLMRYSLVIN